MKTSYVLTGILLITTLIPPAIAVEQGPVYGVLPQQGIFYTRYPAYRGHYAGTSELHGIDPTARHGHRSYLADPHLTPEHGFIAQRHTAIVHNYVRPTLYPGLYRTEVIR